MVLGQEKAASRDLDSASWMDATTAPEQAQQMAPNWAAVSDIPLDWALEALSATLKGFWEARDLVRSMERLG
jgi:hypothetical protein